MAREPSLDRLTSQLYHLPSIIARLGISVANAQKEFNADYVENLKNMMGLVVKTLENVKIADAAEKQESIEAMKTILESLAPSRYQFTETTIDFSADLAETFDLTAATGIGFGAQAIMVNAAFSLGYGYDYRAAARITCKIRAYPANADLAKTLIGRAEDIDKNRLNMPVLSAVEKEIWDSTIDIYNALTKSAVKKVKQENPAQDEA
jgi:hypothetical protein